MLLQKNFLLRGGNATGVHLLTTDLETKRLGLLHELFFRFPSVRRRAQIRSIRRVAQQAQELAEAARAVGRPIVFLEASTDAEYALRVNVMKEKSQRQTRRSGFPDSSQLCSARPATRKQFYSSYSKICLDILARQQDLTANAIAGVDKVESRPNTSCGPPKARDQSSRSSSGSLAFKIATGASGR